MTLSVQVTGPWSCEDMLMQLLRLIIEIRMELIRCDEPARQTFLERQISGIVSDIERIKEQCWQMQDQILEKELEARIMEQFMAIVKRTARGNDRQPIAPRPIWADLPPELIARLDVLEQRLDYLLAGQAALHADVRRGFALLYQQLDKLEQEAVREIMVAIRARRLSDAEVAQWMVDIRQAIALLGPATTQQEPMLALALDDMRATVESELEIQSKLELSIPLIPFLLSYRLDVGVEVEMPLRQLKERVAGRWRALKERVRRRGAQGAG